MSSRKHSRSLTSWSYWFSSLGSQRIWGGWEESCSFCLHLGTSTRSLGFLLWKAVNTILSGRLWVLRCRWDVNDRDQHVMTLRVAATREVFMSLQCSPSPCATLALGTYSYRGSYSCTELNIIIIKITLYWRSVMCQALSYLLCIILFNPHNFILWFLFYRRKQVTHPRWDFNPRISESRVYALILYTNCFLPILLHFVNALSHQRAEWVPQEKAHRHGCHCLRISWQQPPVPSTCYMTRQMVLSPILNYKHVKGQCLVLLISFLLNLVQYLPHSRHAGNSHQRLNTRIMC